MAQGTRHYTTDRKAKVVLLENYKDHNPFAKVEMLMLVQGRRHDAGQSSGQGG
ncbi:hypothetical protein F443_07381 [Phytophthora nicotianae P1569]|uniref:Uncharacterized protein n=1 Tax=Phytophthora nicotianae P1569 TaxID=1317065 RepID=V9FAW1_PHYNI|nr:hypothetical protein F443_07381 [Phytophthora nicotianae P1569]